MKPSLFRVIITDPHFLLPAGVLAIGLGLLMLVR
jgi:hypothetical protein